MLALVLKILLMYICVSVALAVGETVIVPFLGNIKATYASKADNAAITGYAVICAAVAAFSIFLVKFATMLPADLTRFLGWTAAGAASEVSTSTAASHGGSTIGGVMERSDAAVTQGAEQSAKNWGNLGSGIGTTVSSQASEIASSLAEKDKADGNSTPTATFMGMNSNQWQSIGQAAKTGASVAEPVANFAGQVRGAHNRMNYNPGGGSNNESMLDSGVNNIPKQTGSPNSNSNNKNLNVTPTPSSSKQGGEKGFDGDNDRDTSTNAPGGTGT